MEKKIITHITKGLIIALVLVVFDLVAGFAGFRFDTWYRWTSTLVLVAGIIWACISFSNQNDHAIGFGGLFTHGFKTSAVVSCMIFIFTLVSIFLLFPETRDIALQKAREQMEQNGKYSQDQIDQGIEITKKLFVPFAIAGAILGTLIVGTIASLIGAAVAKKKPVTPFDQQP